MSILIFKAVDPWAKTADCIDWCREHGLEPGDTYEIHIDTEVMTARVFQFAKTPAGRWYAVRDTDGKQHIAKREPFTVPITRVPGREPDMQQSASLALAAAHEVCAGVDGGCEVVEWL